MKGLVRLRITKCFDIVKGNKKHKYGDCWKLFLEGETKEIHCPLNAMIFPYNSFSFCHAIKSEHNPDLDPVIRRTNIEELVPDQEGWKFSATLWDRGWYAVIAYRTYNAIYRNANLSFQGENPNKDCNNPGILWKGRRRGSKFGGGSLSHFYERCKKQQTTLLESK